MSEENKNNHTGPLDTEPLLRQQMRKTSSVPLRKETVRVALKSTPAGAKPAAPAAKASVPTSMTPGTAPNATKSPSSHNPDIPGVTSAVPLKQETMRVTLKADVGPKTPTPPAKTPPSAPKMPAPAPTIPLGGGAPRMPAPAPTIPLGGGAMGALKIAAPAPTVSLNVGPSLGGPATIPLATQPLGNASRPLPKATVQLQQTQQLTQPGVVTPGEQPPIIQTVVDGESSADRASNGQTILVVAAFLLSLFLLFSQFQRAGIWVNEHENESYGAIFSSMD
ncbi:hypothetical protein [Rubritalea profundi]|uniref:Uncharacterized protein n=1 Tax=Rubritalea profundi TaxID=1658618 RepID=A0A2S7TZ21_9BACT|nr:hypothetical protein [Rubritalea profundi]PQJ27996.1 hypothetical protein BSZ32_05430 [Rubritalea profundi]